MTTQNWDYNGDGQAYPSDRLLPDFLRDGEEWHDPGTRNGENVIACYYFSAEEIDGKLPEDYPWGEDHIMWIATRDGEVLATRDMAGFLH